MCGWMRRRGTSHDPDHRSPHDHGRLPAEAVNAAIPFNRPFTGGATRRYLLEALERAPLPARRHSPRRASEILQSVIGAPRVLLTTSCTHALEMAALLLDIGPGDEVVLPTFTFVSTANAFLLRG